MNAFNIHRFFLLLKQHLYQSPKFYLVNFAGMVLAYAPFQVFYRYNYHRLGLSQHMPIDELYTTTLVISFFVLIFMGSQTFASLSTKAQRISYLMIPATNLEKVLSRIAICAIGGFVLNILAIVVADLLAALLFIGTTDVNGLVLPQFLEYLFHGTGSTVSIMTIDSFSILSTSTTGVVSFVDNMSLFLVFALGSVVFRKKAFVRTGIIILLLTIVGGFTLVELFDPQTLKMLTLNPNHSVALHIVYLTVIDFLLFYLVYRLFARISVISRKFF